MLKLDNMHLIVDNNALIHFDLELRPSITIIEGDSGTGKTMLIDTIKDLQAAEQLTGRKYLDTDRNIQFLNFDTVNDLSAENTFYIIDNADILLTDKLSKAIIRNRFNSRFLIFGRRSYNLGLSPNYFGEFYDDNGVIRVKFEYSELGWW